MGQAQIVIYPSVNRIYAMPIYNGIYKRLCYHPIWTEKGKLNHFFTGYDEEKIG